MHQEISNALLFLSVFFVYSLTAFPFPFTIVALPSYNNGFNFNLDLFATINLMLNHPSKGIMIANLIGNIVLFIPFGFSLSQRFQKLGFYETFLLGLLFSFCIEIVQLFVPARSFDIDDILLNLIFNSNKYWFDVYFVMKFL
jgi:glycopeptide antibiotics resistance protein